MGLLTNLLYPVRRWWDILWYNAEPASPPPSTASVVNMPSAPPAAPALAAPSLTRRVVEFRGEAWQEEEEKGHLVRFSREIAVNGRAVKSELTVAKADLTRRADGRYTLNGRE